MLETIDLSLVNWSRAQFAMTAIIHWLFIPITIGITYVIAFAQTIHVKTGDPHWEKIAKFWAKLFGVNFALGVGTGIILGLEFGTNWSNYSWISGDLFGAPLAAEGLMAFLLESTFIAVMFFGWGKLSKKFHLLSIYLVAFGATLSALWILVANAWMNYPVGMTFNPDTARHEMVDFWAVLLSPFAINKFVHTVASCLAIGSFFMISISSWYLLKKREILLAKRSLILAAVFGLTGSLLVTITGDVSGYNVAQHQPAKLAALEGHYTGSEGAGMVAVGFLTPGKKIGDDKKEFIFEVKIPKFLSILGYRDANAFVPGINDLVYGNEAYGILSAQEKMNRGRTALNALADYKEADARGDEEAKAIYKTVFDENYRYMGYGQLSKPENIIPPIPIVFYSFRIMVFIGLLMILIAVLYLWFGVKNKLEKHRWLLKIGVWMFPLSLTASMAGWIVAEVGRQPWTIEGLLATTHSTSNITTNAVILTFWIFLTVLLTLLVAEMRIMTNIIKKGPNK
jgi:cytochrome bd ubiquinol oxidase subunit I